MPFGITTKPEKPKADAKPAAETVQKKDALRGTSFAEGEQALTPPGPVQMKPGDKKDGDKKGFGSKLRDKASAVGGAIAGGYSTAANAVGGAIKDSASTVGGAIKDGASAAGGAIKNAVDPEVDLEKKDRASLLGTEFATSAKDKVEPDNRDNYLDGQFSYWHGKEKDRVARALDGAQQAGVNYEEVRCLVGYTSPAYVPMNLLLRGQLQSKAYRKAWQPIADKATSALKKLNGDNTKERDSLRGWRRVPNADPAVVHAAYGKEFITESAFMSTTVRADAGAFKGPVEVRVKGVSGARVEDFSLTPSEGELLYPPGMRFHVDDLEYNADLETAWIQWHKDCEKTKPGKPYSAPPASPWFVVTLSEPRNAKPV